MDLGMADKRRRDTFDAKDKTTVSRPPVNMRVGGDPPPPPPSKPPRAATDTNEFGEKTALTRPDPAAEKPISERVTHEITINYRSFDEFVVAYTEDISRGGLFVATDQPLPVEVEVARGAEVGRRRERVVGAEEGDLAPIVGPADDAGGVEVDGAGGGGRSGRGTLRSRDGGRDGQQQRQRQRRQQGGSRRSDDARHAQNAVVARRTTFAPGAYANSL